MKHLVLPGDGKLAATVLKVRPSDYSECPHRHIETTCAYYRHAGACRYVCQECGDMKCSECDNIDGTVVPCDWCQIPVCVEHDDVLMNRDIDSDLALCQPCGDKYDEGIKAANSDALLGVAP